MVNSIFGGARLPDGLIENSRENDNEHNSGKQRN
jgi:hypothetical protein